MQIAVLTNKINGMKKIIVVILSFLLFSCGSLMAQSEYDKFLDAAREAISKGDCDRAQKQYNNYKYVTNKIDADIEYKIKKCKESKMAKSTPAPVTKTQKPNSGVIQNVSKPDKQPTTGTLNGQEDIPISNTGVTPVQTVVEIEEMVENKDEKNVSAVQLAIYDSVHNSSSVVSDTLYAKGISVYRNGEEIPESQLRIMFANTESYDLYVKGLKSDKNAKKMFWTGIALVGTGMLCQLGWVDPNLRNSNSTIGGTVGGGFCIAGLIVGFVGVTTEIIGGV